jgi:hypothetical protein
MADRLDLFPLNILLRSGYLELLDMAFVEYQR